MVTLSEAGRILDVMPQPMVGRTDEATRLAAACGLDRDGGGLAVLSGDAGIGKTRLLFHLSEQARASGKPEQIIEKMVEGRLRKFYEEVVLLSQVFVVDAEKTVAAAVKAAEGDAGAPIAVTEFIAFRLGEGVEKEETDFAAEVAAAAGTGPKA